MLENLDIKKYKRLQFLILLIVIIGVWRLILFLLPASQEGEGFNFWSFAWGASYQVLALYGAVMGFIATKSWGGWKSMFGRAILAFSFGLLFQSLGQASASYFVYKIGEVPYPAFDDIGFFGSIIFYIYGIITLARISGVRFSLITNAQRAQAIVVPLFMVLFSYIIFLRNYEFDWTSPLKIFLDFGYPLGQAFYIANAILIYILCKKVLGGVMRTPVIFFIIALTVQYLSDFTFLYQVNNGLYVPEGLNDCIYFVGYALMAFSLIQLSIVFNKLKSS